MTFYSCSLHSTAHANLSRSKCMQNSVSLLYSPSAVAEVVSGLVDAVGGVDGGGGGK
jgi:hypothetical protein